MSMPATDLHAHVRYTSWATHRLLKAAAELTPDELTRDHGTADKSVVGSLAHIFAADRMWLSRVVGSPRTTFIEDADRDLALLHAEWPALLTRWDAHLAGQTDESVRVEVPYRSLAGDPFQTPLWQIVLHVVNHGTHHRGQVSGFLRAMGKVPPPLDLIAYYREHRQA